MSAYEMNIYRYMYKFECVCVCVCAYMPMIAYSHIKLIHLIIIIKK